MNATFTVCLPHKRNPGNDKALDVALDCLFTNTRNDFKLIIDAAYDQPLYPRINRMVEQADTQYCVYMASDVFLAPAWDTPMLEWADETTFVNGVLVEPGAIGLHHWNLLRDFGRKPDTFRRADFEEWVTVGGAPFLDGEGWYCPYMFPRDGWLAHGGLMESTISDNAGFTAADIDLFLRWKASGNRVLRVPSYSYHLQRFSDEKEQNHEKRNMVYT